MVQSRVVDGHAYTDVLAAATLRRHGDQQIGVVTLDCLVVSPDRAVAEDRLDAHGHILDARIHPACPQSPLDLRQYVMRVKPFDV